jgi:PKD repeat protein
MKKLALVICLVVVLAGSVACSASSHSESSQDYSRGMTTTTVAYKTATAAPTTTKAPAPTYILAPAPVSADTNGSVTWSADVTQPATERMVIRNGNLQLVVDDITAVMTKITNLVSSYNGFIVNSNVQESNSRLIGNISFRVPAEKFENTLAALRAMAVDVKLENTSGQDVTQEFTDLTSSLRNLEAAEQQLLKIMDKADKVSDVLAVEQQLIQTRGQIEQTKGRMQYLQQSAAMSLISVTLEQSKLAIEFTASARDIKAGETIYFNPTVSGGFTPYSYSWDFGDGITSTEAQPSYSYKKNGTYTVSLKVTDDRGNTVTLKRDNYINVMAGWKAGNTANTAVNGLVGFGHFLANLFIWLGIFSPVWLVTLAIVLYFAWWKPRKRRK